MKSDDTICYCFHVTKRKIVNFLRVTRPRRASQISQCGGAGTGCGWCVPFLKKYFEEQQRLGQVIDEALSPAEYAQQRAGYIRAGKGRPAAGAIPLPEGAPDPTEE
ncbi:MAG: (2Fe-2S)-binding protein [Planctomycetaceae bacterium]|nr:(2Fe-2S)-binding protein [Planctomycetaceae bacterium]